MFVFTHIEKCAGTSFNEILSLTYPRYFHITKNNYGGNEKRNDLTIDQYKKILHYCPSGIGGHSVRPYLEFLPNSKRITFLRNPIERYISQFNHLRETGWVNAIDEFLNNEFYNDFMTKKIAGINEYTIANTFLVNFDFVGDADNYNKSLNYLQDVLDKKLIGKIQYKNQRKYNEGYLKYSDLSETQKLKAEENNKNDIKIYEEHILKSSVLKNYSDNATLKIPSTIRIKVFKKIEKYKKEKIINPIRLA